MTQPSSRSASVRREGSGLDRRSRREAPAWLRGIYAGVCLYLFLAALSMMGSGLGAFGRESDLLVRLFAYGANPFVALLGSVLVTAIVQSSSFTTALIVTLVATGEMTLGTAVFAIMGANIGTSVTALIVALANFRIRSNFKRSFTAALLHDLFNVLTVILLFPFEWISGALHPEGHGLLTRTAARISDSLGLEEVVNPDSPVKVLTQPLVAAADWLAALAALAAGPRGLLVAAIGLVLLFVSLIFMVRNLRGALLQRVEGLFHSRFFRTDLHAYGAGTLATVLVQSSTITTSLMVTLAGAGVVPMRRLLPFMMGSNLGTTVTSVLAATANPVAEAMTVALVHVLFNLIGTLIWYPLRRVPYSLADWYGDLAARSTRYAFLFLLLLFFGIPAIGITVTELFLLHG